MEIDEIEINHVTITLYTPTLELLEEACRVAAESSDQMEYMLTIGAAFKALASAVRGKDFQFLHESAQERQREQAA